MNTIAQRILTVAREGCPDAEIVEKSTGIALLIPTVVQWKEVRTDDPIGALIPPHSSILIALRLMYAGPESGRTATFKRSARLTLNQPAERLLDDAFNRTVRGLLSSATP